MMEVMEKFFADKKRGISIRLFAELCGLTEDHLRDVFQRKNYPLTEFVQRRVNRAYEQWINGDVAVMRFRRDVYLEFRKKPKQAMVRRNLIEFDGNQFKLNIGVRPKADDYRRDDLDTQIRKKHGRLP
jgi:uncharacterized protein YllA (UPF0747 family)